MSEVGTPSCFCPFTHSFVSSIPRSLVRVAFCFCFYSLWHAYVCTYVCKLLPWGLPIPSSSSSDPSIYIYICPSNLVRVVPHGTLPSPPPTSPPNDAQFKNPQDLIDNMSNEGAGSQLPPNQQRMNGLDPRSCAHTVRRQYITYTENGPVGGMERCRPGPRLRRAGACLADEMS